MRPKLSKRILKYMLYIALALAAVYGLIWIILQGYSVPWTGFADFTRPSADFERGKTLWNWMELLIIPIFLAVGVLLLNRSEQKTERQVAIDRRQEERLQAYLDKMSELLLKERLLTGENEEAKEVARIRSLTVLRGLDGERKGLVISFLHDAGLINTEKTIVDLKGADLTYANLTSADLQYAQLRGTNMSFSNLTAAFLQGADLSGTYLVSASLYQTLPGLFGFRKPGQASFHLNTTAIHNMKGTNFSSCDMRMANLQMSTLIKSDFSGALLDGANLEHANLSECNLQHAKLADVSLKNTLLRRANLSDASVTQEQLEKALLFEDTIMPNGEKYKK